LFDFTGFLRPAQGRPNPERLVNHYTPGGSRDQLRSRRLGLAVLFADSFVLKALQVDGLAAFSLVGR
jgi:hypothetical protein